jgi:hypothetical protein
VWKECCAAAAVYIFLTVKNVQLSQFIQHDKNKSQPPLIQPHRESIHKNEINETTNFCDIFIIQVKDKGGRYNL